MQSNDANGVAGHSKSVANRTKRGLERTCYSTEPENTLPGMGHAIGLQSMQAPNQHAMNMTTERGTAYDSALEVGQHGAG